MVVDALLPADSPRRAAFERRGALLFGDVHPAVAEVAGAGDMVICLGAGSITGWANDLPDGLRRLPGRRAEARR